jgi:multiple sugar transport system substrate-binding protein
MRLLRRCLPWIVSVVLFGCSPAASLTATPTEPDQPGPTPSATATPPTLDDSPVTLLLWLPARFSPDADNPAARLLSERLQTFDSNHPGITVSWRIKDEQGPAGLLETLRAADSAAPAALPDLVALDPTSLNTAALKGLVVPLTDIVTAPTSDDWYPHAVEAAQVDGAFFGYPFASEASVLAYRSSAFDTPPLSWSAVLESNRTFLVPAGDPDALFTLIQYDALGGSLQSSAGLPALDPTLLSSVLAFYGSARSAGVLPRDIDSYQTDMDTWQALKEGRVHSALAPLSQYFAEQGLQLLSVAPLPTRDGAGTSMGLTWSWALVAKSAHRQQAIGDLLRWLADPAFLGSWTESLGLIPPQPAALDRWSNDDQAAIAALLAATLRPRPTEETLATFGPPLHEAILDVLSEGKTPDSAALAAAQSVHRP